MNQERFSGQVERIDFSLEQVECLASSIRSEVFWAFSPEQPKSVAEVAAGIGKSAQTVHYHVNELVKRGLLIAVETRRQHARTEALFVHTAVAFYSLSEGVSREYREQVVRGFQAMTRAMARERESLYEAAEADPSIFDFSLYRRTTIRLTPERARELKFRLRQMIFEAAQFDEGDEGEVRVNISVYLSPTVEESRRWRRRGVEEPAPEKDGESDPR